MGFVVQPFNAITLSTNYKYVIKDNMLYNTKHFTNTLSNFVERVEYVSMLYKNKYLDYNEPNFYLYRVTNSSSALGLLAKIRKRSANDCIYPHEQIIKEKVEQYSLYFGSNKIQINPVVLIHNRINDLENYYNLIISYTTPIIQLKDDKDILHEMWILRESSFIEHIYSSLKSLLIADGHHRMKSLLSIPSTDYFLALLISETQLCSRTIHRKYNSITIFQEQALKFFLSNNFCLHIIDALEISKYSEDFHFIYENKIFRAENSGNKYYRNSILDFMNRNINFASNGKLNFINSCLEYADNKYIDTLIQCNSPLSIIIPCLNLKEEIQCESCYPPHSTWLEPKIPDGLISMLI